MAKKDKVVARVEKGTYTDNFDVERECYRVLEIQTIEFVNKTYRDSGYDG